MSFLKMSSSLFHTCSAVIFLWFIGTGECVRCYQCASSQNKAEDICGAYRPFEPDLHIAVECNSDEATNPGSFCMKVTQQGPRGFIWDGRWRQVIRRCASVADTGVTGVCNWGVFENGVYWEECYCSSDECNSSTALGASLLLLAATAAMTASVL